MTEYIKREEAIKPICEACNKQFPEEPCEPSDCTIMQILRSIPAADVRPVVSGKWGYNDGDNIPYCSECMMPQDSECNFCPNCGADMREES